MIRVVINDKIYTLIQIVTIHNSPVAYVYDKAGTIYNFPAHLMERVDK